MSNLIETIAVWMVTLDGESLALGFMLGGPVYVTIFRWLLGSRPRPAPYAWNRPEVLPPVDCPLVLRLGSVAVRAERVSYLRDRSGEMDYRLSDGSIIRGRYQWSYP